ncbi:MAG: AAA domain-containing protein, partial [Planctomycetota bacterium]
MRSEQNSNEEVTLTGILSEFRIALQEEIEAAIRNSASSAVPLVNGKRLAQIGGSFQYQFVIENILNVPGDTPGDLYIPGRDSIPVTVISVDGMVIILSVSIDLGTYVPTARLQSNLAHLMRKLIERIESKADSPNDAGNRILNGISSGVPIEPTEWVRSHLNADQQKAVCSSLGLSTTFIWGPPGTGKTMTIGEIGGQSLNLAQSLLVVSHTNTAVDEALLNIGDYVPLDILETGRVLRVGESKSPVLNSRANLLLQTHVDKRSQELAEKRDALKDELASLIEDVKQFTRSLDIAEWVSIAEADITKMETEWRQICEMGGELESLQTKLDTAKESQSYWENAASEAHATISLKKQIASLLADLNKIEESIAEAKAQLTNLDTELSQAKKLMYETRSVGWLTRKWRGLPPPDEQLAKVESLTTQHDQATENLDSITAESEKLRHRKKNLEEEVGVFFEKYQREPSEVLKEAKRQQELAEDLKRQISEVSKLCSKKRSSLHYELEDRWATLHEFDLVEVHQDTISTMLEQIRHAYENAQQMVKSMDILELQQKRESADQRIRAINIEIDSIEAALKRVEDLVIADAAIVATTLTRAYLRDSIQNRMFDIVVLDEASMAPIPALWIAAGLARSKIILVGDYKQLPPIVLSNHNLAEKWLGRDIFEVADVDHRQGRSCFVSLTEQHRMHPQISLIPNKLVYSGMLTDGEGTESTASLDTWYRRDWGRDRPVLLVDTESTNAWVTSVPRGTSSSRLNFLSATICIDIADQLLRDDRPNHSDEDRPRILIVCPYRPHAQLLQLLIRENQLMGEVVAGTAHSFQGSEADVVILDLVNDEPHWRVALFTPSFDSQNLRLLNVALTRAKSRLIVVGDFKYILSHARHAFMGKELVPFLQQNYESIDALEIVQNGLAAKAAQAQLSVFGGEVEPEQDRLVVTQEHFYRFLLHDILHARTRIVLYSPFITQDRLAELEPQIRAAGERGVQIFVVTKATSDRNRRERGTYRMLEDSLRSWGANVVHKQRMHEKLVFIDKDILWEGSLNPLSFSNTREHMERRRNARVFEDYSKTIRLDELLGEYDDGIPTCPICGSEVVACEGRDEPFYWHCVVKDCYSRSIDQPPIRDGIIKCYNCDGPVEIGEWGGKPCWRCTINKRHHQRVARTHLRLPKMRAIIPKRELAKL